MIVESLRPERYAEATGVLVRAFERDPMYQYVCWDPVRRLAQMTWMLDRNLRLIASFGASHITRGGEGVALWLPPEACGRIRPWDAVRAGWLAAPFRLGTRSSCRAWRVVADILRRQRVEITRPHWVLDILGVDPVHQGRGIAKALLQHVFACADRDGTPCHVLTHNPQNIAFYQRYEFSVVSRDMVCEGGPFVCSLRRDSLRF